MDEDRLINSELDNEEVQYDNSLRPSQLAEYVGQEKIKENLNIFIAAAKMREESLDHVLFYGPPGLGKTTLANIIAGEMGANLKSTSGPVIEKTGDLAALLTNLKKGDVLFIDEIHRLSNVIEEILYSAMEDYKLDIMIGQGPSARSIKLELPPFTLVGATTRAGLLTSPLRDRFGVVHRLDYYNEKELETILTRSAGILEIDIVPEGANEIARRSRGTPRIANRLLRRVRDYAQVKADGIITREVANDALEMMEVDGKGLDKMAHFQMTGYTSGSGFDMALISLLKRRGFSFSETKLIIHEYPYGKGSDMDDRYFIHTWKKAEAGTRRNPALTDAGNAERFAERFQDELIYVTKWRCWLHWNGVRWEKINERISI